ncbi:MAG TPA: TlpA disulfide reductase family protein [Allosphingosinicella sp.]|jgi:thiol-disulfide isomerase/thioredoxin|nr:TlpA disulfide reductase family protein [Allosphingosinicella sp.]
MRAFLPLALLLVLAGCQKQGPAQGNAQLPDQPAWSGPKGVENEAEEVVEAPKIDRTHKGSPAPTAEFEDPDGEKVSFAVFEGKPLLVNFWATWCTPCVAEMPTLDALAGEMKGRVQVVTLSQDQDGRAKVAAFFNQHRFKTIEPYLDPQMEMTSALQLGALPTTILYDAKGHEIWRAVGPEDWQSDRAKALLNEAFQPAKG